MNSSWGRPSQINPPKSSGGYSSNRGRLPHTRGICPPFVTKALVHCKLVGPGGLQHCVTGLELGLALVIGPVTLLCFGEKYHV